jgi:nicotinic acid mononucleotide adenylyltransferase
VIIPKILINTVANKMVKHFKLDKIMSYVFEDNELDKEVEQLKKRVDMLEIIIKEK